MQAGYSKTALVLIALAIGAAGLLIARGVNHDQPEPELTEEIALELLKDDIRGCEPEGVPEQYRSCTVTIVREGDGRYIVTVTHDGFFDDSVRASRIQAVVTRQDGAWVKGDVIETYQCWPGRGHQDFSSEFCV